MGFATVLGGIGSAMVTNAAGFIGDFGEIFGALVGIAFAGYALMIVRRFIG